MHRTVPFRNHATVSDTRIIEHYRARLPGGQGQHQGQQQQAWDGSYVIWVVPPEVDGRYPRQVVDEDGACVRAWRLCIYLPVCRGLGDSFGGRVCWGGTDRARWHQPRHPSVHPYPNQPTNPPTHQPKQPW